MAKQTITTKKFSILAEREGFEPSVLLTVHTLSNRLLIFIYKSFQQNTDEIITNLVINIKFHALKLYQNNSILI